jgi:hypothetical protein
MQASTHCADHLERSLANAVGRHSADWPWMINVRHCVPQLAELLAETRDEPIERLAPAVRSVLLERCEVDVGGDLAEHSDYHQIEHATDLLLKEMERVRRIEFRRGDWSDAPVPPLMCG